MKQVNKLVGCILIGSLVSQPLLALEVDREVIPRITLGGRAMATLDGFDWESEPGKDGQINTGDSAVLARFDKRMYTDGVAGAVVGFKESEDTVKFHQLHAFYWNQDFQAKIGLTRLRNTLIEFPLIRDDDFLSMTHVGNASSNDEFDQIYGKQVSFDWFVDKKIQRLGVWAGTRRNGDTFTTAPDGFDSYGAGYVYEQPEDLRYVKWIRHAGILLDSQKVSLPGGDDWLNSIIVGIEFNLNMDPTANWSVGLQAIDNGGVGTVTAADLIGTDAVAKRAQARSRSLVASLRYTGRPKLLTRWQAALTLGYKDYTDVSNATEWSVAPSYVYRLGQGVDLLAQYRHTSYGSALGDFSDNTVQLGVSFSLEAVFNDTIGARDSILNLEHGYIK